MTEHPRDDLAAYALGALDERERAAVDAHTARCDACTTEVEGYRAALVGYADAADVAAPDLRGRIVERARRAGGASTPVAGGWIGWLRRPLPVFVPAALALLLVASLIGLGQVRRDADAYAAALSAIPGARVVDLPPSTPGSELRGAVILPPNGAPFVVLRIPAPPAGRTWEAWVLHGDTPIAAGISSAGGVVTITLTAPLGAGDGVAVTLEPAGGTSAPTTAPVLVVPRT